MKNNNFVALVFLSFFALLCFFGCKQEKFRVIDYHDNGNAKLIEYPMTANGVSKFETFYENGSIKTRFFFVDTISHGLTTTYYPNGIPHSICQYFNDKKNGICRYFRKNGTLKEVYFYHENEEVYNAPYDSLGNKKAELFSPYLEFHQDTIPVSDPLIRYSVSLPLPDSLLEGKNLFYGYGIKPEALKDSFTFDLKKMLETPISNKGEFSFEVTINGTGNHLFYNYLVDRETKDIYYPSEIEVIQEDSFWVVSPSSDFLAPRLKSLISKEEG
jgi:antitoxin component YwqK of YwqJK toxin-antitoxin module